MGALDEIAAGAVAAEDDEISIDLSGAGADFDEPAPPGTYRATLIDVKRTKSKDKEEAMLQWTLQLSDEEQGQFGRQVRTWTMLEGKAKGRGLRSALKAFGINQEGNEVSFRASDLIGEEVDVVLAISTRNADFNDVKKLKAIEASSALD